MRLGFLALPENERRVYASIKQFEKSSYSRFNTFQDAIAAGKTNDWKCRAGARYLYICEDGLVHYCSQQRGYPGVPVEQYTKEDVRREYNSKGLRTGLHRFLRASNIAV